MTIVNPLIAGESRPSADRTVLRDVHGRELADVGLAPRLAAQAAVNRLRRSADGRAPAPEVFREAARLFATAELDGEGPDEYVALTVRGTGLTTATVRRAMADLTVEISELPQIVAGAGVRTLDTGRYVRHVPAGRLFAAVMASNHPLPHGSWIEPLAHGYSVLVRPGSRDPFTPRRLAAALLAAGLPPEKLAVLPSRHEVGGFLLEAADRGVVYGSEQAVSAWRDRADVAVRGPGRSRALLDLPPAEPLVEHLASAAAFDGGTRCMNLSAVLTSHDAQEVARRLALRLARLPVARAQDAEATLLVLDRARAEATRRAMEKLATELTDHSTPLYDGDFLVDLGDGSYLPRPMVFAADHADHPALGTEYGFPFVVVAPWRPGDGQRPLSPALVLNLLTEDDDLAEQALLDPGVRKVTRGPVHPWERHVAGMPHDGDYTAFLLDAKGLVLSDRTPGPAPEEPAASSPAGRRGAPRPQSLELNDSTRMLLACDGSTTVLLQALTGLELTIRVDAQDPTTAGRLDPRIRDVLDLAADAAVFERRSCLVTADLEVVSVNHVVYDRLAFERIGVPDLRQPIGLQFRERRVHQHREQLSSGLAAWGEAGADQDVDAAFKEYLIHYAVGGTVYLHERFNPRFVPVAGPPRLG